jgi:hypothetical protein
VSPSESATDAPITVAIDDESPRASAAVWKRLKSEPLEGLALVWGSGDENMGRPRNVLPMSAKPVRIDLTPAAG